jgi:hypothetical protein
MAEEKKRTCGECANYAHMGFSELMGICRAIPGEKPGQRGKKVMHDMDASECPNFAKLEYRMADVSQPLTDLYGGSWRASPVFDKGQEKMKGDRLIYEKHERERKEEGK